MVVKQGIAFLLSAALIALLASSALGAQNAKPVAPQKTGQISGTVDYCGAQGNDGILVYIPGMSFQVTLGPSGLFGLFYVPVGTHRLLFRIPNQVGYDEMPPVSTADNTVTELGVIRICRDNDRDSFTEDKDCNDTNPAINPDAAEICNGKDDNCDGTVDEGCDLCTDGDNDGFFAQAGCAVLTDCDDANASISPAASEICNGIDDDCDLQVDEGFYVQTDANNCGVCGRVCPTQNAVASCVSGECQLSCNAGFQDCNGEGGCETSTATDPANCGACGNACAAPQNARASCYSSTCQFTCEPVFANCNNQAGDGCEVNLSTDANNCGGCGRQCVLDHAVAECNARFCRVADCVAGYQNCNGSDLDGCETNVNNDHDHCGSCGNACSSLSVCFDGQCVP